MQEPQLGTGHALLQAARVLTRPSGTVVLLSGDVPLLTSRTPASGCSRRTREAKARRHGADGRLDRPVRLRPHRPRRNGAITRIVEERDASPAAARDQRNQFRHLRVRRRAALRRARRIGIGQRAGRVLPARPRRDLPQAPDDVVDDRSDSTTPTRFAASTAAPNSQRSAPWCDSRRTKS